MSPQKRETAEDSGFLGIESETDIPNLDQFEVKTVGTVQHIRNSRDYSLKLL